MLAGCLTVGSLALGGESTPLYIANQNPFVQIFGLPKAEPGTITPKGRLNADFLYHVSNNAIRNNGDDGASIILDGETAQYTTRLRCGIFDWLELGLDVPFVQQGGGYLDSLIRNFHSAFGMPNDRQEMFEKNQIHYLLTQNGDTLFELQEARSGLGDIRLTAAIPVIGTSRQSMRHLAFRPMLKLPTGSAEDLLGSGGTDFSASLAYSDYQTLRKLAMILHLNVGMLYMGNADVLREKQQHLVGYGGGSLGWQVWRYIELKVQLDYHSALYDIGIDQLGTSLQLLGGGTVELPGDVFLDLGISEQLVTDATPDVGFYLMVRHLF
jgi:hypothetical protein